MPELDRENPEWRYSLHGDFDEHSYDQDLEDFPEYFDDNGWPLFGDYDRYVLVHPFTGLSWHVAPRELQEGDTKKYEYWHALAQEFDHTKGKMVEIIKNSPASTKQIKKLEYIPMGGNFKGALGHNVSYIRTQLIPALNKKFSKRKSDLEFSLLWGEFNAVAGTLGLSLSKEKQVRNASLSAQKRNKDAPLKWYFHMEKKFVKDGLTTNRFNAFLKNEIYTILTRHSEKLAERDLNVLKKLFRNEKGNKEIKIERVLADFLVRRHKDADRKRRLLASKPSEVPKIPSLDKTFYKNLL